MEKEVNPTNSEQVPDIDSLGWDALKDAPNSTFNQKEPFDDGTESFERTDNHNKDIDRAEAQLKNALIESNEKFTRRERAVCNNLADELKHSHLDSLSRPVQEFGDYSSRLDSERFEVLLEYLDQKFSPELNDEDKKRITDELRDTYYKDTTARAGLLAEESDTVWKNLNQMESKALEKPIYHMNNYRKNAPNYQVQIAKAYFDYFDEPTDRSRNHLTHKVEDYLQLLRHEFGGIAQDLTDNKIGTKDLPDSIFRGLSQNTSKNYEEMHDALLKYFDYKNNEALKNKSNTKNEESVIDSLDKIKLDDKSSNSLPSDIF